MSKATELYDALMVVLLKLINQGKGDGEMADAIRDRMDRPWNEMTEEEQNLR